MHVADDDDDDDEQHEHDGRHAHASVLKRLCICVVDEGEVAVVLCARLREGRDLTLVAAGMGLLLFMKLLVKDTYPPLNSSYRRVQTCMHKTSESFLSCWR